MPRLSKGSIFIRIKEAAEMSGGALIADEASDHPFKVRFLRDDTSRALTIYTWNLTPGGGRKRPEDEMRVQLTGVNPPLDFQAGRTTLLLGWNEDLQVFAAYDARRHRTFSRNSPSIQTRRSKLEDAARLGISFESRGNDEIVVAFRPDMFGAYLENAAAWHGFGDVPDAFEILEAAPTQDRHQPIPRRFLVQSVHEWYR